MIFIDPTEARENTRLPDSVIRSSIIAQGLESYTGADLLISPLSAPTLPERIKPESTPWRAIIDKHIKAGLLVQRKTGRDLTGSIPRLPEILLRMQQHTHTPWLLIVGDLDRSQEGECIVDGHKSGFDWVAVSGALDWWQLRGGMLSIIRRDSMVAEWVNGWLHRCQSVNDRPIMRLIRQRIATPDWKDIIATFPNVGPERAYAIAEANGSLAWSLSWLSDLRNVTLDHKIPGVGIETIKAARSIMGLDDGQILSPITIEESSK